MTTTNSVIAVVLETKRKVINLLREEITLITPARRRLSARRPPFFKKKSTPNTVALIQDAQSAKMNFSAIFEQINVNQYKRDKNNESKLQLYHNRTELKRRSQEYRIERENLRLKEKSNNRRFTNITSMIELTRKEIVLYKDMPEMRAESAERLRKYYAELETLNSQL